MFFSRVLRYASHIYSVLNLCIGNNERLQGKKRQRASDVKDDTRESKGWRERRPCRGGRKKSGQIKAARLSFCSAWFRAAGARVMRAASFPVVALWLWCRLGRSTVPPWAVCKPASQAAQKDSPSYCMRLVPQHAASLTVYPSYSQIS